MSITGSTPGASDPFDIDRLRLEFEVRLDNLRDAAALWGVRPHHPEGVFISSMISTQEGFVDAALCLMEGFRKILDGARVLHEDELARLRVSNERAQINLEVVRFAEQNLDRKREEVTQQLTSRIVPDMVKAVQKAVVIREERFNKERNLRWILGAGAAMLALVLVGYGWASWSDWGDSGRVVRLTAAIQRCVDKAHWADPQGHKLCDVEDFKQAAQ